MTERASQDHLSDTWTSGHSGHSLTLIKHLQFFAEGFQGHNRTARANSQKWVIRCLDGSAHSDDEKRGRKNPAGPQSSKLDIV